MRPIARSSKDASHFSFVVFFLTASGRCYETIICHIERKKKLNNKKQ